MIKAVSSIKRQVSSIALILALSLNSAPAYALKGEQPLEARKRSGLEEAFQNLKTTAPQAEKLGSQNSTNRRNFLGRMCLPLVALWPSLLEAASLPAQQIITQPEVRRLAKELQPSLDRFFHAMQVRVPPGGFHAATDRDCEEARSLLAYIAGFRDRWNELKNHGGVPDLQSLQRSVFDQVRSRLSEKGFEIPEGATQENIDRLFMESLVDYLASRGIVVTFGPDFLFREGFPPVVSFWPAERYRVIQWKSPLRSDHEAVFVEPLDKDPKQSDVPSAFFHYGTRFLIPSEAERLLEQVGTNTRDIQKNVLLSHVQSHGFWDFSDGFKVGENTRVQLSFDSASLAAQFSRAVFLSRWGKKWSGQQWRARMYEILWAHENSHGQDSRGRWSQIVMKGALVGGDRLMGQMMEQRAHIAALESNPELFLLILLSEGAPSETGARLDRPALDARLAVQKAIVSAVLENPGAYGIEIRGKGRSSLSLEIQVLGQLYQVLDPAHSERLSKLTSVVKKKAFPQIQKTWVLSDFGRFIRENPVAVVGPVTTSAIMVAAFLKWRARRMKSQESSTDSSRPSGLEEGLREEWSNRLDRGLIPAVPVWLNRRGGGVNEPVLRRYAKKMAKEPIIGVAINVHTGRGPYLTDQEKETVYQIWREALGSDKIIVSGANSPESAQQAKQWGVNAVLVMPPFQYRDLDPKERKKAIVDYHKEIARVGLPMILFYLYEETGIGIHYTLGPGGELQALLRIPQVVAIKSAGLSNIELYQDIVKDLVPFPYLTILTGEDRFFPESLQWIPTVKRWFGERAKHLSYGALVGMSSAYPALEAEALRIADSEDPADMARFGALRDIIHAKAGATFIRPQPGAYDLPMEPYVYLIMLAASHQYDLPLRDLYDLRTDPQQVGDSGRGFARTMLVRKPTKKQQALALAAARVIERFQKGVKDPFRGEFRRLLGLATRSSAGLEEGGSYEIWQAVRRIIEADPDELILQGGSYQSINRETLGDMREGQLDNLIHEWAGHVSEVLLAEQGRTITLQLPIETGLEEGIERFSLETLPRGLLSWEEVPGVLLESGVVDADGASKFVSWVQEATQEHVAGYQALKEGEYTVAATHFGKAAQDWLNVEIAVEKARDKKFPPPGLMRGQDRPGAIVPGESPPPEWEQVNGVISLLYHVRHRADQGHDFANEKLGFSVSLPVKSSATAGLEEGAVAIAEAFGFGEPGRLHGVVDGEHYVLDAVWWLPDGRQPLLIYVTSNPRSDKKRYLVKRVDGTQQDSGASMEKIEQVYPRHVIVTSVAQARELAAAGLEEGRGFDDPSLRDRVLSGEREETQGNVLEAMVRNMVPHIDEQDAAQEAVFTKLSTAFFGHRLSGKEDVDRRTLYALYSDTWYVYSLLERSGDSMNFTQWITFVEVLIEKLRAIGKENPSAYEVVGAYAEAMREVISPPEPVIGKGLKRISTDLRFPPTFFRPDASSTGLEEAQGQRSFQEEVLAFQDAQGLTEWLHSQIKQGRPWFDALEKWVTETGWQDLAAQWKYPLLRVSSQWLHRLGEKDQIRLREIFSGELSPESRSELPVRIIAAQALARVAKTDRERRDILSHIRGLLEESQRHDHQDIAELAWALVYLGTEESFDLLDEVVKSGRFVPPISKVFIGNSVRKPDLRTIAFRWKGRHYVVRSDTRISLRSGTEWKVYGFRRSLPGMWWAMASSPEILMEFRRNAALWTSVAHHLPGGHPLYRVVELARAAGLEEGRVLSVDEFKREFSEEAYRVKEAGEKVEGSVDQRVFVATAPYTFNLHAISDVYDEIVRNLRGHLVQGQGVEFKSWPWTGQWFAGSPQVMFEGPGLIVEHKDTQFLSDEVKRKIPLRVVDVTYDEARVMPPLAWVALAIDRELTIEKILSKERPLTYRMETFRKGDATVLAIFESA